MKKNILISIFLLFVPFFSAFSQKIYTTDQIKDILSSRQYTYKSIEGLELKLSQDDAITFYENGSFNYNVGDIDAEGTWVIDE